jgi:hypothetical protein
MFRQRRRRVIAVVDCGKEVELNRRFQRLGALVSVNGLEKELRRWLRGRGGLRGTHVFTSDFDNNGYKVAES